MKGKTMKFQMNFSGDTMEEMAGNIVSAAKTLDSVGANSAVSATEGKRTRRTKAQIESDKAAEQEIEDEEELEEEDAEEEIEEELEEEDAEEIEDDGDDKISEKELKTLKAALKTYSDKNGKGKAVKTLMKFAKTSDQVTKDDLPKLLKLLK